jgi:Ca2+:H+ antiporter
MARKPHPLRAELPLVCVTLTAGFFLTLGAPLLGPASSHLVLGLCFLWLFAMIFWGAVSIVRHADFLAARLGEPYGTLILTLAVISIEVVTVTSVMLASKDNPDNAVLARDTMYGVVMIVLNGLVGGSLLLGGLRHGEPEFNITGARSYLAVLLTLGVIGLILPDYTVAVPEAAFSTTQAIFVAAACIALYGIFLWIQTARHRDYFVHEVARIENIPAHGHAEPPYKTWVHGAVLVGGLIPVFVLCKKLAHLLDAGLDQTGAPAALGGFLVALLVLAPEGLGAFQAAWKNSMQRAVNICLGSALATIGLTIPAVLGVSLYVGQPLILGIGPREITLLALTFLVSTITFSGQRTNVLLGAVHLVIFAAYFIVIFDSEPESPATTPPPAAVVLQALPAH